MLNYMCLSSDLVKQLHRQHRVRARQLRAHRPLQQQLQLRKRPLQQQRARRPVSIIMN